MMKLLATTNLPMKEVIKWHKGKIKVIYAYRAYWQNTGKNYIGKRTLAGVSSVNMERI